MVSLDDIRSARDRIAGLAVRTPLLPLKDGRPGTWLKCENLQRTGAFKVRGAANRIARLPSDCRGVVAHSSGNHAQAVACAARARGLPACIVMLDQSVAVKVEGTRAYGAEVVFGGPTSASIQARADAIAQERGWVLVSPFNQPDIIAGQGTVGLEILEALPDVAAVLVPIGGGGLISGVATALKETRPGIRVIGVEPEGAPTMTVSVRAGKLTALPSVDTVADGLKPVCAGDLTLATAQRYVDEIVLVSDAEILDAARHLILREKLVVEPSGAAALAAVRAGKGTLPDGPVAVVLSGGNIEPSRLVELAR
ncbi:MAG TPA: threonine/serine dehydratase [Planctomycetota bacterium]|nr:threonine/serine dehydratase [Planctomycetota bacterium]